MSGLCVVSSATLSVLDGLWRPVFYVLRVMRVIFCVIEVCVVQFIVCKYVAGSVVIGFAGEVGDLEG
jgi:hypothetical protein